MTKEETNKAIEVMQAYVDGKTIGYMRDDGNGNLYFSESESPAWNWFHCNYLVRPKMTLVEEIKKFCDKWNVCVTFSCKEYSTNDFIEKQPPITSGWIGCPSFFVESKDMDGSPLLSVEFDDKAMILKYEEVWYDKTFVNEFNLLSNIVKESMQTGVTL